MTIPTRVSAALLAFAFLLLHLGCQPVSLEDLDSINFALGIRQFNVEQHQPHPPGYPLLILAAKGVNALVSSSEARALSLLGIVCGAFTVFALVVLFDALEDQTRRWGPRSITAALLTVTAPLFWFTASRPLSDVAGLSAALAVQAMIVTSRSPHALAWAGAAAGLCAGIRSQVVWLTVPLLLLEIVRRRDGGWRTAMSVAGAYFAGVLVWAVPLVALSGGPASYWRAISNQGAEDLSGVTMLWTTPTPRQLARALYSTFVAPWALWPIAVGVLAFATLGSVRLLLHGRRPVVTLAAAFGLYLAFDVLFQETVTTRYALPLVVPVAYLATIGIFTLPARAAVPLAVALAFLNATITTIALYSYSRSDAPAFRMLADMRAADAARPTDGERVLAMHRREEFDLRRPIKRVGDAAPAFTRRLTTPPKHEWLEVVKYWNEGGRDPIWFVADPLRSDLALFDHGRPRGSYRWSFNLQTLIGGVRPSEMDWYVIDPPNWYLEQGWALTPETAGVAREDGRGPGRAPIRGFIRRHPGASTMLLGGRNLADGGPLAALRIELDGRPIGELAVPPGFFLRIVTLPAGTLSGDGDYASLTVKADTDQLAIEQFDAKADGGIVFGFGEGWHELEYDPATGRLWRWTSDRATLRVHGGHRRLMLNLSGALEAASSSRVTIRAADRVVAEHLIGREFSVQAPIPADALAAGESTITIETSESYVPAERSRRSRDRRRLGLKIYECQLTPAS